MQVLPGRVSRSLQSSQTLRLGTIAVAPVPKVAGQTLAVTPAILVASLLDGRRQDTPPTPRSIWQGDNRLQLMGDVCLAGIALVSTRNPVLTEGCLQRYSDGLIGSS